MCLISQASGKQGNSIINAKLTLVHKQFLLHLHVFFASPSNTWWMQSTSIWVTSTNYGGVSQYMIPIHSTFFTWLSLVGCFASVFIVLFLQYFCILLSSPQLSTLHLSSFSSHPLSLSYNQHFFKDKILTFILVFIIHLLGLLNCVRIFNKTDVKVFVKSSVNKIT